MIKHIRTEMRRFLADRRGAVIVYVTLGLGVFMGFSALAIDGSYLYLMSNRAQSAADAAALAAASQLPDEAAAESVAIEYAGKNLDVADFGNVLAATDIEFGSWDGDTRVFSAGASPAGAVRVTVRMSNDNANPVQLFFANALGSSEAAVEASAVSTNVGAGGGPAPACIHALNPNAALAFRKTGTSDVIGNGCSVQVDSCHATEAFKATGSGSVDLAAAGGGSGYLSVCGGIKLTGTVDVPEDPYTLQNTGEQVGDPFDRAPYASMPSPSEYGGCDHNNFNGSGNTTIYPGVYCGGIRFSGSKASTFAPGTYYIKDGSFKVSGSVKLTGEGVTFVMTGASANIDWSGSSKFAFSAPITGDYAGFVVFGDPTRPATVEHNITGSSAEAFHGIVYLPHAAVKVTGSTGTSLPSGTHDCSVLIADTIEMTGSSQISVNSACSEYVDTPAFQFGEMALRLVD